MTKFCLYQDTETVYYRKSINLIIGNKKKEENKPISVDSGKADGKCNATHTYGMSIETPSQHQELTAATGKDK